MMRFYILLILLLAANIARAQTLRDVVGSRLLIGAAVMSSVIDDKARATLLADQFNCLSGENEFKPDFLEPLPGQITFDRADRLIEFARQHKLVVVGHCLCWHNQTPGWFYKSSDGKPLAREQALANLKLHIDTVMHHFKGKMLGWDAVNEALGDKNDVAIADTPPRRAIGDDYVLKAFEFAHAADPDAELYYNDYAIEQPGKRDRAIHLIRRIQAAGLRIDAVGIQGHWGLNYPDISTIEDAIVAFHALGIKVSITELDIDVLPGATGTAEISAVRKSGEDPYRADCPETVLQQQAQRYRELFEMLGRHRDAIERITFWGLDDGHSWLNDFPVKGRTNYPLLWDRQLKPKPAFDAVLDVLKHDAVK